MHFLPLNPEPRVRLSQECNHTPIRSTLPTRGVSNMATKAIFKSPSRSYSIAARRGRLGKMLN